MHVRSLTGLRQPLWLTTARRLRHRLALSASQLVPVHGGDWAGVADEVGEGVLRLGSRSQPGRETAHVAALELVEIHLPLAHDGDQLAGRRPSLGFPQLSRQPLQSCSSVRSHSSGERNNTDSGLA